MSNDPTDTPEAPADDAAPDAAETAADAPPSAEEILAGLEIAVHPVSLRWATKWAQVLQEVSDGATERDACAIARVSEVTWRSWLRKGRGDRKAKPPKPPLQPYADLSRALAQVIGERNASVRRARLQMAKGGDVRAAEAILTEGDAMKTAHARASAALAQTELLKLQIEREKVTLEMERIKLQRMQGGGADTTVQLDDVEAWAELQKKAFGAPRQGTPDGAGHHPTDHGVASGELPPLSAPLDLG